jgi:hypothetical protein
VTCPGQLITGSWSLVPGDWLLITSDWSRGSPRHVTSHLSPSTSKPFPTSPAADGRHQQNQVVQCCRHLVSVGEPGLLDCQLNSVPSLWQNNRPVKHHLRPGIRIGDMADPVLTRKAGW